MYGKFFLLTVLLLIPVGYTLQISEIMYNPLGSDTGREWIEIYNDDNEVYNLTGWKLATDGSNHMLNEPPENGGIGSMILDSGGYIVIVQDVLKFLSDYPSYSGTVIDSSWTALTNSDPKLIGLKNSTATVVSITYSIVNEGSTWCSLGECSPTPGRQNIIYVKPLQTTEPPAQNNSNITNVSSTTKLPQNNILSSTVTITNKTTTNTSDIVLYPRSVFIGVVFEINVLVNASSHEIYSYVYSGRTPVSLGFNGEKWLGSWDANKIEVNNVSMATLKNIIENDTEPGNYTLRIKLDGKDISRSIEILELPFIRINKTKNSAFVYTNCKDCKILIIGTNINEATRNITINSSGMYNVLLMKGQSVIATEKVVISKLAEKKPLPIRIALLIVVLPRLHLF